MEVSKTFHIYCRSENYSRRFTSAKILVGIGFPKHSYIKISDCHFGDLIIFPLTAKIILDLEHVDSLLLIISCGLPKITIQENTMVILLNIVRMQTKLQREAVSLLL